MNGKRKLIAVRTVEGVMHVSAWCVGAFGVHPQVVRGTEGLAGASVSKYSITHLPSGICFHQPFPTRDDAEAAMIEIAALRDDWETSFDPKSVSKEFIASLKAIYRRHGAEPYLPPADGDRRTKLGMQEFAADLNGYRGVRT